MHRSGQPQSCAHRKNNARTAALERQASTGCKDCVARRDRPVRKGLKVCLDPEVSAGRRDHQARRDCAAKPGRLVRLGLKGLKACPARRVRAVKPARQAHKDYKDFAATSARKATRVQRCRKYAVSTASALPIRTAWSPARAARPRSMPCALRSGQRPSPAKPMCPAATATKVR